MLRTTICGWPGRCLARNGCSTRPVASVPPPGAEPMIMVMVLSLNVTSSAKAGRHAAVVSVVSHKAKTVPARIR
jgi:hypothetical protein